MLVRKPDWNSLSNLRDPQQLAADNPLPLELDDRHPVRPERASRSETWPSWGTGRQTRRFRDESGPQAVSLLNLIFSRYSLFPQDHTEHGISGALLLTRHTRVAHGE